MSRPSKNKGGQKQKPRFVAPANATPPFTLGDVITLLQSSTWAPPRGSSPLRAAQRALAAALAACARIGATEAVSLTFKEALTGKLSLPDQNGRDRPVLLLPAVVKLVRDLEGLRPDGADPALFVSGTGVALPREELEHDMMSLGNQWGFHGAGLSTRLMEFFDACFEGEDDRPAVAILRRRMGVGRGIPLKARNAAALDEDRLLGVLEGHLLAGPAGRWIGARGVTAAEPTMRLFRHRRIIGSLRSEVLSTDPVCIAMAKTAWPARGQQTLRRWLVGMHFENLEELHVAGRLSNADMAYLFNASVKWVWKQRKDRAMAKLSDAQRAEREDWLASLPELYVARRRGEGLDRFYARVVPLAPAHVVVSLHFVAGVLHRAGVR